MKIRLTSITIQNFKGLNGSHTIEFGKSLTLLFGPNGYGKTTIFDAIEFALTGRINRVNKQVNENKRKIHAATVLHNSDNKKLSVSLRLEVGGTEFSITRSIEPSLRVEVVNTWSNVDTSAVKIIKGKEIKKSYDQSIDDFIFGKGSRFTEGHFRLLSYIEQDDSIQILRQSQNDRYRSIGSLLNMEDEEEKLNRLELARARMANLIKHTKSQLGQSSSSIAEGEVITNEPYIKLFKHKEIPYDRETLFEGLAPIRLSEEYESYMESILEVERFTKEFDPKEYNKDKVNRRLLSTFESDKVIEGLIFRNINHDHLKLIENDLNLRSIVSRDNFAQKFLLRNELSSKRFNELKDAHDIVSIREDLLFSGDGSRRGIKNTLLSLSRPSPKLSDSTRLKAAEHLKRYTSLESEVSNSQNIIKLITKNREGLKYATSAEDHRHAVGSNDDECLLCGKSWGSFTELTSAISKKTRQIEELLGKESIALRKYEEEIERKFIGPLLEKLTLFKENKKEDLATYELVKYYGELTQQEDIAIRQIINKIPELDSIHIEYPYEAETLLKLAAEIEKRLLREIPDYDAGIFKAIQAQLYLDKKDVKKLPDIGVDYNNLTVGHKDLEKYTQDRLANDVLAFRNTLDKYIANNKVNSEKISKSWMYEDTFGNDAQSFNYAKDNIDKKISYIKNAYKKKSDELKDTITSRQKKLEKLKVHLDNYSKKYKDSLEDYQKKLANPLKIPFYIYSAKILQNTPRGQGIFIDTEKGTGSVAFLASKYTTQDAVHQLSSGQLAVVSLAFHLALNTFYSKISPKLLIIDDPIQDMDTLNIHSLSEILRREFSKDYQLIMSTHDDRNMGYLKYALTKGANNTEDSFRAINVQNTFYPAR